MEWSKGEFEISTDRERLDFETIARFLNSSYWAKGRSMERIRKSIEHSLPFGMYKAGRLIGFARVVTDYATFAWIADLFVLAEFRGQGLSKWLMEVILSHPELQGFRRWVLATKDAHGLYEKYGFTPLLKPDRWMERHDAACEEQSDYWAGKDT
jgi:GNAT superfamily N-acetyltransferase